MLITAEIRLDKMNNNELLELQYSVSKRLEYLSILERIKTADSEEQIIELRKECQEKSILRLEIVCQRLLMKISFAKVPAELRKLVLESLRIV